MSEIYVSVDVETDGPIPGVNSMLSLGAAAFTFSDGLTDTFSVNLDVLKEGVADPATMRWWESNQEAWSAHRVAPIKPTLAMHRFADWVDQLEGKPVFVGYPAGFDFLFVYWYLIRFTGHSPFSFSALDIKTYAAALLGDPYRKCVKKNFPRRWLSRRKHTHEALDDAIEQGEMFMNMLHERLDEVKTDV